MPLLILFLIPFVEVLVAIEVGDEIGYLRAAGLLFLAAALGLIIMKLTGRAFLVELQLRAARGERIENVLLSQGMRFFAGLLFLIPGFLSDGFALFFLLASFFPALFASRVNRNAERWSSHFVVFNSSQGRDPGAGYAYTRDVTPEDPKVIDIAPEKHDQGD